MVFAVTIANEWCVYNVQSNHVAILYNSHVFFVLFQIWEIQKNCIFVKVIISKISFYLTFYYFVSIFRGGVDLSFIFLLFLVLLLETCKIWQMLIFLL